MGTILLSTVYLKHSSSSLLDLTRAEWFLPGRGPELLWQELFLKIQCKRWKTVSSGISFSRITRNASSCPGRASSATVGVATDLLAGPEGGKLMRGVQHSATAPRCASSHYWPGILFSCPTSSRPPWIFTYWLFCIFTVLDSKPSGLPDQTETSQNRWGS